MTGFLRTRFLALFAACAGLSLAACSQLTVKLPAIADSDQYRPGQVIWRDLLTRDMAGIKHFYGELFGWQFTPVAGALGDADYQLIEYQGQWIGGVVDTRGFKARDNLSQWINVFSTRDMADSVARVKAAGGTLVGGPRQVGERGELALVQDPQGAHFALLQTRQGDTVARPHQPGYFLWQELWNQDGNGDFYQTLFGATKQQATLNGGSFDYFAVDDKPAFAVLSSPLEGLPSTWVSYLQVEDVGATLARVESLGGRILVPAQNNPAGGQLAVILDPSGAGLVIQTWAHTTADATHTLNASGVTP
ncbi:VOC family protein [Simiduia agarivorans]|uniref:Glyoxalase n=1 Tax=Simiduia agarivorans (strain DSM 21679 / JCM 13881 / BCRC 17597 / SA1) TaxID=1117647 RepID=K4KK03_SIMAS|nr:VOC family protein [Simiduia agarivorans]AFU98560.1 glyoxalase [Simiduia agarivorans SA1 = DSM 21679]